MNGKVIHSLSPTRRGSPDADDPFWLQLSHVSVFDVGENTGGKARELMEANDPLVQNEPYKGVIASDVCWS